VAGIVLQDMGKLVFLYLYPTYILILYPEMVLFHAAFVALKSRSPLTVNVNPQDFTLTGERKLFQGYESHPV
jgi:hypothetical protein